jgi:hypothetical protein
MYSSCLTYSCSKGHQSELSQLEMLQSEGYPYNRNAKYYSHSQVEQKKFPAQENYPKDIPQKTAYPEISDLYISAKRQQS